MQTPTCSVIRRRADLHNKLPAAGKPSPNALTLLQWRDKSRGPPPSLTDDDPHAIHAAALSTTNTSGRLHLTSLPQRKTVLTRRGALQQHTTRSATP